jgi:hypothetical protein
MQFGRRARARTPPGILSKEDRFTMDVSLLFRAPRFRAWAALNSARGLQAINQQGEGRFGVAPGASPVRINGTKESSMLTRTVRRVASMRWGLIALLLGLPLPVVILVWLFMGHH